MNTYEIVFWNESHYIQAETPSKAKYKLYQKWREAGYKYPFRLFLSAICGIKKEVKQCIK